MRKRNRKLMSILLTLSLLAALLAPMAAYAGTTYEQVTTVTFDPDEVDAGGTPYTGTDLGTFMIDIDPASGASAALIEVVDSSGTRMPVSAAVYETVSSYTTGTIALTQNSEKAWKLNITPTSGEEYKVSIKLTADVRDCDDGEVSARVTKLSGQLDNGTVVIGKASGGAISAEAINTPSFSDDGGFATIRLTETVTNALEQGKAKSVKLALPSGFSWYEGSLDSVPYPDLDDVNGAYTTAPTLDVDGNNDRYLYVDTSASVRGSGKAILDINAKIDVDDSVAKYGDVTVTISGDSDIDTTSLVVGTYGEFGVTATVEDATTVVAGQLEQEIGTIVVKEDAPGSLSASTSGKTVTLTLPANARWCEYPEISATDLTVNKTDITASGTDGRTIKYLITKGSDGNDDCGKIEFKNGKVHLAVDETGDLKVKIGGTAGASDEVVVATIEPVVSVTANVTEVKIGMQEQAGGDIEITEGKAEAISDDADIVIELPSGLEFQDVPTVEVVEGDLDIDEGNIDVDGEVLTIPVSGTSSTASKIKISGIEYVVNRTVAEGDVKVKIGGSALNEVNNKEAIQDYYGTTETSGDFNPSELAAGFDGDYTIDNDGVFPTVKWAAKAVNAKCVTPADQTAIYKTVFTIGNATYTVNGVEKTMDVEPYIKNDRTYLPIRYAAYAAGITDANIMWNEADQSVIMIKGDRVVKMVIGDTTMYINGVAFTMDVAPEIVDPGRTMLPIRYVAQALGCEVTWDEATQTVTIN
ncbi:copper amine oxidase N-terminal domain-containing protein [Pelotomaculum terephthalicicum JT]|uniref:copper amine oxidase N-terminal domain-containing protein n=1 Tax=Pelotomaculum terephthalicicum TaxID=206393 RepID=UPI001F0490B8|nr:copper amine oxidase N-terminal domain-containing protein [Pelotomaculum terephthalicicum]MCG9967938.1 copper amine oxidase N-terminal domain-containing protein [Pelotomaculum terephthalicicum JT]